MSRELEMLLKGAVTVLEPLIMMYFLLSFQRWNLRKSGKSFKICSIIIVSAVYSILFTAFCDRLNNFYFINFYAQLGNNIILNLFGNTVFFLAVSLLITKESFLYKLLGSFLCAAADFAVELFIPADFEDLFYRFSAQIIKLIIYSVILQIAVNKKTKLGKKEWIFIFSVIGLSFAGIALLNSISRTAVGAEIPVLLMTEACLVTIAAVCFYMTLLLSKTQQDAERLKLLTQQNEFRRRYAESAQKQYEEIRRIRHDIKQAYSAALTLLKEGKTDEAAEFIQDNASRAAQIEVLIDVGDDIINALLNAKLSDAKRQGITILCNVENCLSDMDKIDLCILLWIMLDNAI